MTKKILPIHPGEILLEEFIKPLSITQYKLAKDINVAPIRINEIIKTKRAITVNTALRLSKYFDTSAQFWLNLQNQYDLEREKENLENTLLEIKTLSLTKTKYANN